MKHLRPLAFVLVAALVLLSACTTAETAAPATTTPATSAVTTTAATTTSVTTPSASVTETASETPAATTVTTTGTPSPTETEPAEPAVTEPPSGVIRLFYYAHEMSPGADPAALPGAHVIHSAVSTDGTTFVEETGDRFSYDTGSEFGITDPDVVQLEDGSWLMFISLGQSLLKATSETCNGDYVRDASFRWDQGGVPGSGDFSGTIRTFVTRGSQIDAAVYDTATGALTYTGTALSVPSPASVGSPSIIEIDGTYYMVYLYQETTGTDPRQHRIYIATSPDGMTWSKHNQNTFVCQGSVPGAVYYNGTLYIYYCGVPEVNATGADMGVAVSADGGKTFTFTTMTIADKALGGAVDPCAVVAEE